MSTEAFLNVLFLTLAVWIIGANIIDKWRHRDE